MAVEQGSFGFAMLTTRRNRERRGLSLPLPCMGVHGSACEVEGMNGYNLLDSSDGEEDSSGWRVVFVAAAADDAAHEFTKH